ncbi:hypothetical protein [Umezawaea sp. Da 62-37]|uniref:hypothetical protein n=1 Tax=Umezawaea sp. Da 62-37 TaxID=3075927 RepID=UPI0028F6C397|nr:hypothetical protein [Umezawaea sp. Da 62-37]WNV85062.1 hypothetical protein RM788_44105 [Umezawaea sp. Da 62-37]
MSLTTQLHRGELGRWCATHLSGTAQLVADVRRQVAAAGNPEPIGRDRRLSGPQWSLVAAALRLRLALLVDGSAPATALLCAIRANLVGSGVIDRARSLFARGRVLDAGSRWSPFTPGSSGWLGAAGADSAATAGADGSVLEDEQVVEDFLRRTAGYLYEHAPPGTIGSLGAEAGLARSCWVLAAWELGNRTRWPAELAAVHATPGYTVEDLRGAVPGEAVRCLIELVSAVSAGRTLRGWRGDAPGRRSRAAGPLGVSRPIVVPHWAQVDLLIDRTAIDVAVVASVEDGVITRLLWRLLAYSWLDTVDRHRIRSVGLYLARHGVQAVWGSTTFADLLLGGTGRSESGAREEFLGIARRAAVAEGMQPPAEWIPRSPGNVAMPPS